MKEIKWEGGVPRSGWGSSALQGATREWEEGSRMTAGEGRSMQRAQLGKGPHGVPAQEKGVARAGQAGGVQDEAEGCKMRRWESLGSLMRVVGL